MVSILPRVGLLKTTEMNSFCILRLFRLDTLNKATVRKFIGSGTLDSGLYRTKSCKGYPPSRAQTNGYSWSGELEGILFEISAMMLSSSA